MIKEQYLIEQHIRRLYHNIPEVPGKGHTWHKDLLGGLTNGEFREGVCCLSE